MEIDERWQTNGEEFKRFPGATAGMSSGGTDAEISQTSLRGKRASSANNIAQRKTTIMKGDRSVVAIGT